MTLAFGTRLGSYEVVGLIGAEGMGEVYRARDTRLNRDVALKVLPGAFAKNAERAWRVSSARRRCRNHVVSTEANQAIVAHVFSMTSEVN